MIKLTNILKEVKINHPLFINLAYIPFNLIPGKEYIIKWKDDEEENEERVKYLEYDWEIDEEDDWWINVLVNNEKWKDIFDFEEPPYHIQIFKDQIISIKKV